MKTQRKITLALCLLVLVSLLTSFTVLGAANAKGYEEGDGWLNENPSAPTDYAYSIAIVGDTQTVVKKDLANGTTYLSSIYDWLLANAESKKISYVLGLGDITENDTDEEWTYAKSHITKLDGKLPYHLVRGNDPHDSVKQFNNYFASHTAYTSTLGGTMADGNIANSYTTFTAGETNYLVLGLDWGPSDDELAWAEGIITSHPEHKVIITTHAYLYSDGTVQTADKGVSPNSSGAEDGRNNNGDQMWDKLIKKHPNVFMVFSGHNPSADIVYNQTEGEAGNVVTSFLVNPQNFDAGKDGETGMVAMLYFSANGTKVDVEYISTVREQYYNAANQFSLDLSVALTDVVTKYGVIPAQYADPIEWPLVTFKKTPTTIDGVTYEYTFYKANKGLMKDTNKGLTANADYAFHNLRYTGDGGVLLLRRDYVDTSTSTYTNLGLHNGSFTFDLDGHTIVDNHTHSGGLFTMHEKSSTSAANTKLTVLGGRILMGAKSLVNVTSDADTEFKMDLVFENMIIAFQEGSACDNLFPRFTKTPTGYFHITLKNSVIDAANARVGSGFMTSGGEKGGIEYVMDGSEIINYPGISTKFSASFSDGFDFRFYLRNTTSNASVTEIKSICVNGVEHPVSELETVKIGTLTFYVVSVHVTPDKAAEKIDFTVNLDYLYKDKSGTTTRTHFPQTKSLSVVDYLAEMNKTQSSGTYRTLAKDALSYIRAAYLYADASADTSEIDAILGAGYDGTNAPAAITPVQNTAGMDAAALQLGTSPAFIFYPETDADGKLVYDPADYVFALDGKYLLEGEVITDAAGKTAILVSTPAFAFDNTVEWIVNGTNISGAYNVGAYLEYAKGKGDTALVTLVERLIKYAQSAEKYRDTVIG